MQDLLLNRIRGALRGAAIGEAAAASDRFTWPQVKSGEWLSSQQNWPQTRLLIASVEQTIAPALNCPIDRSPASDSLLDWLPIALFFHENPALLRQQIDRRSKPADAIEQACILALSEAIALALREELLIDQLLPRLSESVAPVSSIVSNQLLQVQAWLESQASLATVERSLNLPASLARLSLSFYGWLSVPQDLNLALLRSQGSSAAVWLGALAGADHGMRGIAIDWWQPFSLSATHQIWQTEILEPIDRLADQLVAAWAGVDAIASKLIDRAALPEAYHFATGAAGLIRPR